MDPSSVRAQVCVRFEPVVSNSYSTSSRLPRRDRGLPGHWTLLAQTISCRGVLCKLIMHKRLNEHFIVASACLSLFG